MVENLWLELVVSNSVLFVTNDFGPRAGGIETFVIGLIERRPFGTTIIYTSSQDGSESYDQQWKENYGVVVIRDRAKILLPTPRVARNLARIIKAEKITVAAFGAAACTSSLRIRPPTPVPVTVARFTPRSYLTSDPPL